MKFLQVALLLFTVMMLLANVSAYNQRNNNPAYSHYCYKDSDCLPPCLCIDTNVGPNKCECLRRTTNLDKIWTHGRR